MVALSPTCNLVLAEHVTGKVVPRSKLATDVAEQHFANNRLAFAGWDVTKVDELLTFFTEHAGRLVPPHGLLIDEKHSAKRTRNLHQKHNSSFPVSDDASIEQSVIKYY